MKISENPAWREVCQDCGLKDAVCPIHVQCEDCHVDTKDPDRALKDFMALGSLLIMEVPSRTKWVLKDALDADEAEVKRILRLLHNWLVYIVLHINDGSEMSGEELASELFEGLSGYGPVA